MHLNLAIISQDDHLSAILNLDQDPLFIITFNPNFQPLGGEQLMMR